jgi:predicted 3-demethylubiquinone-9 3-methyltransferase (glyoxalase superfamily)
MSKIIPHLWYTDKAEEAAAFYASVLPNSKVESVTALAADTSGRLSPRADMSSVAALQKSYDGRV